MLSRGWLPASADDAVFAVKCGNERQQLFVAKLHPCICAYEGQKELKLALKMNVEWIKIFTVMIWQISKIPKDFWH